MVTDSVLYYINSCGCLSWDMRYFFYLFLILVHDPNPSWAVFDGVFKTIKILYKLRKWEEGSDYYICYQHRHSCFLLMGHLSLIIPLLYKSEFPLIQIKYVGIRYLEIHFYHFSLVINNSILHMNSLLSPLTF